jgi:hypothetical protein
VAIFPVDWKDALWTVIVAIAQSIVLISTRKK